MCPDLRSTRQSTCSPQYASTPSRAAIQGACQTLPRSHSNPIHQLSVISDGSEQRRTSGHSERPRFERLPATAQEPLIGGRPNPLASSPCYNFITHSDSQRNQQNNQAVVLARARIQLFGEHAKNKPLPPLPADEESLASSVASSDTSQDADDDKDFYTVVFGRRRKQETPPSAEGDEDSETADSDGFREQKELQGADSWNVSVEEGFAGNEVVGERELPNTVVEDTRSKSLLDPSSHRRKRRGAFTQFERAIIPKQTSAEENAMQVVEYCPLEPHRYIPKSILQRRRNAPVQRLDIQPVSYQTAAVLEPVKGAYGKGAFDLTDGRRGAMAQIQQDVVAEPVPMPTRQVSLPHHGIRFFVTRPDYEEPVEIFPRNQ